MAKVTIIIPSYNHQKYIEQRLDSILYQSYKDWEAIIIDDKSSDDSVSVIENYLNNNPDFKLKRFIKNDINSGSGYKSWQKGIELAQTEFIWIAETDDFCDTTFLEITVTTLEMHANAALVFTGSNYVDKHGNFLYNSTKRFSKLNLKTNETKAYDAEVMIKDLPTNALITNGSSVVFKKPTSEIPNEIFENKQISDLFFLMYLLKTSSFVCVNKMLNSFRRHDASTTTINFGEENSKVYKEYVGFVNYFQLGASKSSKIVDHFITHFLIPNRKKVGYFYTRPLQGVKGVSRITFILKISKAYIFKAFNTMAS